MKTQHVTRLRAAATLLCGITLAAVAANIQAQTNQPVVAEFQGIEISSADPQSAPARQLPGSPRSGSSSVIQSLLDKAHAFELRGRMDLAKQTWKQVLLTDPNNATALAGMARATRLDGSVGISNGYLERLREAHPGDPNIARVESLNVQQDQRVQLQQAGKLAEAGKYAAAMAIYRQVFRDDPPSGDWALAYYETEAATEEGRTKSVAGLTALVGRYPNDSRYQIALGRILTYNPKTRAEGRRYLARYANDPEANEAIRQSLLWDSPDPAMAPAIRSYLATHRDPQLAGALQGASGRSGEGTGPVKIAPASVAPGAGRAGRARASASEIAAYQALNLQRIDDAEARFNAILAKEPENPRALAGMGYVRMQQGNFSDATSYLEQAKRNNSTDKNLDAALETSRFWSVMSEGDTALDNNDLTTAETRYRDALAMRPNSPEAFAALGGTMLKAHQPAAAIGFYQSCLKLRPAGVDGWRGLFLAEYQSGKAAQALSIEAQEPATVRTELRKDTSFVQALAGAYTAVGRDSDAQRVLESALIGSNDLNAKANAQMQFAATLMGANRLDQAIALYRQVLAADHDNIVAWQNLVRAEHALGHDAEAQQTVESMSPANYEAAMHDPSFEATLASVYQARRQLDVAQNLLEKALAQQTTVGEKPSPAFEMQLAGVYTEQGNTALAYPIYQMVLTENPNRADAWAGVLSSLHATGHDKEAVEQVQLIPQAARAQLDADVGYLQTMAAVYGVLGRSREAAPYLARVQQYYAAAHTAAPVDVEIQNAWLLYNGFDDAGLYRQLMTLGGRPDLSEEQRRTVQTIWTNWAVRRANQSAAAGNPQRALAILNAAAHAFPDNPAVIKALATGYANAGQPGEAVRIYKAQNMAQASSADYKAAIGAALASGDTKIAEAWLRFALAAYSTDPQVLLLAAKFEQARGDTARAIEYYHRSLAMMPPADPSVDLSAEMALPATAGLGGLPGGGRAQELSDLLAPGGADTQGQAYLPSYSNRFGDPYISPPSGGGQGTVPSYMTNPAGESQPANPKRNPGTPQQGAGGGHPANVGPPQSRVDKRVSDLPSQAEVQMDMRNAIAKMLSVEETLNEGLSVEGVSQASAFEHLTQNATPEQYQRGQVAKLTQRAAAQQYFGGPDAPAVQPAGSAIVPATAGPAGPVPPATAPAGMGNVYGPFVPYIAATRDPTRGPASAAVPVQLGDSTPHPAPPLSEMTDVIPAVRSLPNARGSDPISSHPEIAAAQAASIRRHQSDPNPPSTNARTGYSPAVDVGVASTEETAYVGQPQQGAQVARPIVRPDAGSSEPGAGHGEQQYSQPRSFPGSNTANAASSARRRVVRNAPAAEAAPVPGVVPDVSGLTTEAAPATASAPAPPAADSPGMYSPGVGQPLNGLPYPLSVPFYEQSSPGYAAGAPPSDAELMARNLPPLRSPGYKGQVPLPVTPRQEAENSLASLEGSYSGWLGGTGVGRYRSGTPGLDRLYDLEAPVEASTALGHIARLTLVARPVFLNSGTLNPATFATYSTTAVPYLGTLPANAANPPAQQLSNGIGGELQLTTKNLGLAAGYTPYNFLVANITGRFHWRPGGGPVTIFGDRDAVKDTQLSYAGLRDPGTITPTYVGNTWGGVVSTTGGLRLNFGGQGAGFYLSGEGGLLKGSHVLTNNKVEGAMGAYFRVKNWPGYGSFTLGGSLFGMHYAHNELALTYGQGGYFSPREYFLASVPMTFNGQYGANLHYVISGGLGFQTFQQDSAVFYPLDPGLQTGIQNALACTLQQIAAHNCGESPVSGVTGFNYTVNSEVSYLFGEHWFLGGFLAANNTNHYDTVSSGFFFRYTFRRQREADGHPTGLFPIDGFRPVRIP